MTNPAPRDIAVIGVGYVGLTMACCLADLGHSVVAIDIDEERIAALKRGESPIHEPGIPQLIASGTASGLLSFTGDLHAGLANADFVFFCVATPPLPDGHTDLSHLDLAAEQAGPHLKTGARAVLKSTVPVGTNERVVGIINRDDVAVVNNPEFLREGRAVSDFTDADRVVVGAADPSDSQAVADLYGETARHVLSTDTATAELVKYATNAFLASRLSFVNELAAIASEVGGCIDDVVAGLGMDRRIGGHHLSPGPGWGGSCFPKDIRSLQATASDSGVNARLLGAVVDANADQFDRVAEMVEHASGGDLSNATVAFLGLTFKADTDDIRESPALEVLDRVQAKGATVVAYDPTASETPREGVRLASSALDAVSGVDVVAITTEWDEFRSLDAATMAELMAGDAIVDARNVLEVDAVHDAGLRYFSVGRPVV